MPLYHYQAYDSKGKSKKGYIEARNEQEARDRLREMGVMVKTVGIKAKSSSKQNLATCRSLYFYITTIPARQRRSAPL